MNMFYVESKVNDPYINLGYEEWMLEHLKPNQGLFYLWQNQHTVVIGRNQNAFKECKVKQLQADGGKLARRSSGGGAVYHDLGNLNFTFILPSEIYDVTRQLQVIIDALASVNIKAEFVGRNDIEVNGSKVSGNAFAKRETHRLHHGTLLFNVNMSDLAKYLNVSTVKMQSKGVESVRKRVANLIEFNPDLTLETLKQQLKISFEKEYQVNLTNLEMDIKQCSDMIAKYQSPTWQTNVIYEFDAQLHQKFNWGEVQAFFKVNQGVVEKTSIFTDSLDATFSLSLEKVLKGVDYDSMAFKEAIQSLEPPQQAMALEMIEQLFG